MSQYICPICEKPMSRKHYCSYCRAFVKNPIIYNGPAANAGDVQMKSDCMADVHYGTGDVHHDTGNVHREYRAYRAPKKKNKAFTTILASTMIVTAATVAVAGWGWREARSHTRDRNIEIVNELPDDGRFTDLDEDMELTDEEAIAIGDPCTGYAHFDMDVGEFCSRIEEAFEEQGLTMEAEDKVYSRNVIFASGYSYFETDMYIGLYNAEGEEEVWMNIEYDTVSRQPHDIWIYTSSIEDMERKMDVLNQAAEELTGDPFMMRGEWADTESNLEDFLSAARTDNGDESGFIELENTTIWGNASSYSSGERICLSIEPAEEH